jgi:hypothetical protein
LPNFASILIILLIYNSICILFTENFQSQIEFLLCVLVFTFIEGCAADSEAANRLLKGKWPKKRNILFVVPVNTINEG